MFGKIIENKLVFAGKIIKTETGTISNPTNEQLIDNGWKEVVYVDKPTYDKEEEKLVEEYAYGDEPYTDKLYVSYTKVALTDEEHNQVIQQEINEEEQKQSARYVRSAISGDSFAISKLEEIESKIAVLREKLR